MFYLVTFYSLYLVISALVGVIKYRKNKSPTLKVVKSVNFITASVSLLMLQTTILATFGVASPEIRMAMNGVSGIVISIFVMVTAALLIGRSFNDDESKPKAKTNSKSSSTKP